MTIDKLTMGVDFKRCDECEYRRDASLRDDLLITAGMRVAYMLVKDMIDIPEGVEGAHELAMFIARAVDYYLNTKHESFDLFIEERLLNGFRKGV